MTSPIWLNGQILNPDDARISPMDRGFQLGDGLFETIRVSEGALPHYDRHLARLEKGCAVLMFLPPDLPALRQAALDLLAATDLREGVLRLTVTRGPGTRGILPPVTPRPTVLLQTATGRPAPPSVRLGISRYRREGDSPLGCVKSLAYLPAIMARMEAVAAGWEDALLLGTTGAIAETTAANLLYRQKGALFTPPLKDGPLPGTSRARLLECGFCHEKSIRPEELSDVTEMWLVNALSLIPVRAIEERAFSLCPEEDQRLRRFLFGG
ncbi:aminotransferase class IV [Gluconobacter morbifer]|uniref:Probable branched-chain-amino-acid aminotransferase n=1 Tax=Gluconobacter morbifer G707 TaxID=1088869 RepID=G6XJD5_9PROT|nr:aminotransferase class IV [Gluconobacter morbifer]EHH68040.1 hypothetical protein GMO_18070 [Gluconobacter morbifer G707]